MKKESTKEKILSAARTLFVDHGFAGTSIGNIAKLAGVNHSLIFHHFKNKEQLWVEVKQRIVLEANNNIQNFYEDLPWNECLKDLFIHNITFYRNNPDIMRMINWQRLEKDSNDKIGVTNSADMEAWIELIKKYQRNGDIASRHKPEWVVTLLLSIISSAALDPNVFISDEQQFKGYINFCIDAIDAALK